MVLDIGQDVENLNKGIINKKTNSNTQKFRIVREPQGKYKIYCVANNKILEIPNGSAARGVSIFAGQENGKPYRLW